MIHAYAVLDAACVVPELEGVCSERVEPRVVGDLAVAVGLVPSCPAATEDAALAHAAVVEALAGGNDAVLPARFGTWFAGEGALVDEVEAGAAGLRELLVRVRGCREIGVVATPHDTETVPSTAPATGTEYLRDRLLRLRERELVASRVHQPLARLARAALELKTPQAAFRGAYLVERTRVAAFHEAVEQLSLEQPELAIVSTQPLPPYSFAGEGP